MRQCITLKQWEGINEKEQQILCDWANISSYNFTTIGSFVNDSKVNVKKVYFAMTIGEMINFLGNNWYKKLRNNLDNKLVILKDWEFKLDNNLLCSFLWTAVRFDLSIIEKNELNHFFSAD